MRKYLYSVLCILCSISISANVIQGEAVIPDGYYDGVSGKKTPDAILDALQLCISKNYNEINYKALEVHYLNTDFYADTLWDVYSTCRFTYDMANIPQSAVCDGWNKEHVCCQSWLGNGPMVSDMFNVYPTDARVNNLRSNYPYGIVGINKGISGDPKKHALGKLGTSTTDGVGTVYEPDDKYKGDLARTFFYMVARYRDNILNNSKEGKVMYLKDSNGKTNLTDYSLSFLLDWHRNDPVSEKEIDRNQGVYGEQNNRNPFIDYPDLVEYIWGDLKGQTVDLSQMTPTCDGGSGVPKTKYGVTWTVNGEELYVDSVIENRKVGVLPDAPNSCSSESETFVGWTDAAIAGIADEAPEVLYTAANEIPAITADITLHAVFAHAEVEQTGTVETTTSLNFKQLGYSNKQLVTRVESEGIVLTCSKAGGSTDPAYYDTGEGVRFYPKNTMNVNASDETITQIMLTFGTGDSNNPITVNTGTFSGDTWTGEATDVLFTFGGSSGHRRISTVAVTINGNGDITTFSRFITSCSSTQDLSSLQGGIEGRPLKLIVNGHMYIQVGESLFTITGQKIK